MQYILMFSIPFCSVFIKKENKTLMWLTTDLCLKLISLTQDNISIIWKFVVVALNSNAGFLLQISNSGIFGVGG